MVALPPRLFRQTGGRPRPLGYVPYGTDALDGAEVCHSCLSETVFGDVTLVLGDETPMHEMRAAVEPVIEGYRALGVRVTVMDVCDEGLFDGTGADGRLVIHAGIGCCVPAVSDDDDFVVWHLTDEREMDRQVLAEAVIRGIVQRPDADVPHILVFPWVGGLDGTQGMSSETHDDLLAPGNGTSVWILAPSVGPEVTNSLLWPMSDTRIALASSHGLAQAIGRQEMPWGNATIDDVAAIDADEGGVEAGRFLLLLRTGGSAVLDAMGRRPS